MVTAKVVAATKFEKKYNAITENIEDRTFQKRVPGSLSLFQLELA